MFRNAAHLRQEIGRFGLNALEENIVALARPAVQMIRTRADEDTLPLGASKLGGNPDVPAGFEWPHCENRPLQFVGQFRLSEVAYASSNSVDLNAPQQLPLLDFETITSVRPQYEQPRLPEHGLLHLFCDAEYGLSKKGSWRVFYYPNEDESLVRIVHPTYQTEYSVVGAFPNHALQFNHGLSLPIRPYVKDRELLSFLRGAFPIEHENMPVDADTYWDMLIVNWDQPRHYFYGYPWPIQFEVEEDAEYLYLVDSGRIRFQKIGDTYEWVGVDDRGQPAKLVRDVERWQFLFQIDSDPSLEVIWGDVGTIYVCIPKASLFERQFEDCWVVLQCT